MDQNPIIDWFRKSAKLGVNKLPGRDEIQTNCPYCGHERFYFNYSKMVGYCHRARCNRAVTLEDLIKLVGYGPSDAPITGGVKSVGEPEEEINLDHIPPLVTYNSGYITYYPGTVEYLHKRGLTDHDIVRFNIRFDGSRIYLPIYDDKGVMRQYNSRLIYGEGKKYMYAPNIPTTKYLLGWSECKLWAKLTLVENSFVSIWLRNQVNCTTPFGSHLSTDQALLIRKSNIESVAVLFDEGAEVGAAKAVRKLKGEGVPASFGYITGQPDDYTLPTVVDWADRLHKCALEGEQSLDFREG